jgi:hypothetical protein
MIAQHSGIAVNRIDNAGPSAINTQQIFPFYVADVATYHEFDSLGDRFNPPLTSLDS